MDPPSIRIDGPTLSREAGCGALAPPTHLRQTSCPFIPALRLPLARLLLIQEPEEQENA